MTDGYCTAQDVKDVLQKTDLSAGTSLDVSFVESAITAQSRWLRERTSRHWYQSTADSDNDSGNDILASSTRGATGQRLDVPSSPHRQDRQLVQEESGVRYPVTHSGPYARIRLPHYHVQSLDALEVRDRGGGVTDWTTASGITQGRGEDYYLETESPPGRSYLYVRAASLGPRVDYTDLLTLDYQYGVDGIPESVRRGVAAIAGADLVMDDDVKTAIPSNGQLVAVDTKADRLIKQGMRLLDPFLEVPTA